jgi:Fe-S-cluster containining protein
MLPAETADGELLRILDGVLADAASRAGGHLACHRGCAVCCFGPFAITAPDALRLRRGLEVLRSAAPGAGDAIRERASRAVARLRPNFPGDADTGILREGEWDEARFAGEFHDLACPVLDPDSGACLLYEHRPVACRTYGLPLRLNGEDLPPCPLCFRGAAAEEIERCRAVMEPEDAGERLTAAVESGHKMRGRTVIAFAMLGGSE